MKRFGLVIVLVFPLSLLASDFAFAAWPVPMLPLAPGTFST